MNTTARQSTFKNFINFGTVELTRSEMPYMAEVMTSGIMTLQSAFALLQYSKRVKKECKDLTDVKNGSILNIVRYVALCLKASLS